MAVSTHAAVRGTAERMTRRDKGVRARLCSLREADP
jgi:hypothetical protein